MFVLVTYIYLCVKQFSSGHVGNILHTTTHKITRGVNTGGIRGSEPPPDINNDSLIKIKFLSILVDV